MQIKKIYCVIMYIKPRSDYNFLSIDTEFLKRQLRFTNLHLFTFWCLEFYIEYNMLFIRISIEFIIECQPVGWTTLTPFSYHNIFQL